MATKSYTITRGGRAKDVVEGAGSAVGTDTLTLNIDITNMTHGEAVDLMEHLQQRILQRPWPPA